MKCHYEARGHAGPVSSNGWILLADRMHLSGREVQIARAILEDQKEASIALHLGISPHTVHTHLERLYRKLGVSSRLSLAVCLLTRYIELLGDPETRVPEGDVHRGSDAQRALILAGPA